MTDQLYKAVFRHDWTSAQARSQHMTQLWFQVSRWLNKRRAWSRYVNHYVNVDDAAGTSELVVVMRDRNMAVMLKLALG